MTINKINNKGFVSTKNSASYNDVHNSTNFKGKVNIEKGISTRWFAIQQGENEQDFTGSFHRVVEFDGTGAGAQILDHGLAHLWNTSSYTFQPTRIGELYSFRVVGVLKTDKNTNSFHIDFELSGIIPTSSVLTHGSASLHRQTEDVTMGNRIGVHQHINLNGFFITDADMVASGAQFFGATSGDDVTFKSGSLVIKEG